MRYYIIGMKRGNSPTKFIIFLAALAVLFVVITVRTSSKTFQELKAAEKLTEIDYHSMQEYSDENASLVMAALKSGKADKLKVLLTASGSSDGVEALMELADWKNADFENAIGMGAGSLSPGPDSNGRIDMSERFFVDVDGNRYVLLIETVTSRLGRNNEGVSAVSATTYNHFDNLGYAWNGKKDDETVVAGKLFWPDNQAEGENPDY